MNAADPHQMAMILDQIKAWPVPSRITLARRILESVEETPAVGPPIRRPSLRDLVGLMKSDREPPDDEECRRIIEEERWKKYGS
jgi:hypothetical protein